MENQYLSLTKKGIATYDVNLDLELLSEVQSKILLKYEKYDEILFRNIGSKNFINMFDKYLFHCTEEIIEARDELYKNTRSEEALEELIDIMLYLGTMNTIIKLNLKSYNMNLINNDTFEYSLSKRNAKEIDVKLMDVLDILIKQRRLFPQRKWHKPSNEIPEIQMKYNLNSMYQSNIKALEIVIDLILNCSTKDVRYINEIINKKEEFVINLPSI